jgi:hypothetical protein
MPETPTPQPAAPALTQQQRELRAASKIAGMNLETPPAPQPAVEQPTVETGVQPPEVEVGTETEQAATDSELEEIEFDTVKFTVPKEHSQKVRDALLREADYTRKTQDVSERARVVSEQEKLLQLNREFHNATIDDMADLKAYDKALAQYANVNWMGMQTDELMRTRLQYDQLKEARQKAAETLNSKWGQFNQKRQEQLKALEKAGRDEASRKIQGFDDKKAQVLKDYALSNGYTDSEVSQMFFRPQDILMIWKAQQFDSLPKGSVQQRVTKAPPVMKPGPQAPQLKADDKQLVVFRAAKNRAEKEAIGREILARKMKI